MILPHPCSRPIQSLLPCAPDLQVSNAGNSRQGSNFTCTARILIAVPVILKQELDFDYPHSLVPACESRQAPYLCTTAGAVPGLYFQGSSAMHERFCAATLQRDRIQENVYALATIGGVAMSRNCFAI